MACDAVLWAARQNDSPVGITVLSADAAGAIGMAMHVREAALRLRIPVILHSRHCHKLLPQLEGLLSADQAHFAQNGEPLFSSHSLNLSSDPCWAESIVIAAKYFSERFIPINLWLELELGDCLWGAVEKQASWPPHRIGRAAQVLSKIGDMFSIVIEETECKSCETILPSRCAQRQDSRRDSDPNRDSSSIVFVSLQEKSSKASSVSKRTGADKAIATAMNSGAVKLNVVGDVPSALEASYAATLDTASPPQSSNPQCDWVDFKTTTTVFERCNSLGHCAPDA